MRFSSLATGVILGLASTPALPQTTLGELVDGGGKKLSKAEVVEILGGAKLSGPTKAGGTFQADFKTDGTFTGSFQSPQGKGGGMFGAWAVDETGKVCTEFTNSRSEGTTGKLSNCAFWYKKDSDYFISDSDSDRSAALLRRSVKK